MAKFRGQEGRPGRRLLRCGILPMSARGLGCVKTLRGKTAPGISRLVVTLRGKKRKNSSSARHYDQISFRFHTAKVMNGLPLYDQYVRFRRVRTWSAKRVRCPCGCTAITPLRAATRLRTADEEGRTGNLPLTRGGGDRSFIFDRLLDATLHLRCLALVDVRYAPLPNPTDLTHGP